MEYALLAIVILGFMAVGGLVLWKTGGSHAAGDTQLQAELEHEKAAHKELQGKNKQLFAQLTKYEAKLESLQKERDQLERQVVKYEEASERRQKEADDRLSSLQKAEKSFQEERARVIRQEEADRATMEAERDRVWAEHETNVISAMTSLCKLPHLGFAHYTNLNLPDGFDGSLKPDFMIEFLGQYVIFDAKASKAESLQTYINTAVKDTVKKVKKNDLIANMLFLVVPSQAISELKTHYYPLDGYNIYVISPESLAPILASLKKITTYELAEQLDPQKRENLINLLAEMDFHISITNGVNLYLAQSGINVLDKAKTIDPELFEEAERKKREMRIPAFGEIKKLVHDIDAQQELVTAAVAPKAAVKQKDIERAKKEIVEKLL